MQHISSVSFQEWRTPRPLGKALVQEYGLDLDVAADRSNTLTDRFLDRSSDGLLSEWNGRVWCNPPYAQTARWLSKALLETTEGRAEIAVLLVPAAVGVKWFTQALIQAEVHLFDRRIAFDLPPVEEVDPFLVPRLFVQKQRHNGHGTYWYPKHSPGGGNALVIVQPGGLIGCTAIRSHVNGSILVDTLEAYRSVP